MTLESNHSTFSVPGFQLNLIFLCYVIVLISKKVLQFQDGVQDVLLLSIVILFLFTKFRFAVKSVKKFCSEKIGRASIVLLFYYIVLSFYSYNSISLIALEFLSVFKWLIYFFAGYLFASVYNVRFAVFPSNKLMSFFIAIVLVYSAWNYNWSGIRFDLGTLFGFYSNSFESIFSHRSVFALFAFVVFVFGLNTNRKQTYYAAFLLGSSFLFLFMSGNRKMLLVVLVVLLFLGANQKARNLSRIVRVSVLLIGVGFVSQSVLFQQSRTEYSNVEQPRILAYMTSIEIAQDYFPIGPGPATFASKGSIVNYSHIYSDYNLDNVWGFQEDDDIHFYNDTYWAQILGQYGVFGFCLVLVVFYRLFEMLPAGERKVSPRLMLISVLLLSVVTPAVQRIEFALFVFFVFGLASGKYLVISTGQKKHI